jgi:hypothetical protein
LRRVLDLCTGSGCLAILAALTFPATIDPLLVRAPPLALPRMPLLLSPTTMLPEFMAVGAARPMAPLAPRVIEPVLVAVPPSRTMPALESPPVMMLALVA